MKKFNIIETYNWLNEAFVHQTVETSEENIKKFDFLSMLAKDEEMFFKLLINLSEELEEFVAYKYVSSYERDIDWNLAMTPKGFDEFDLKEYICDSEDETFFIKAPFDGVLCVPLLLSIRDDELYVYFSKQGCDNVNIKILFSELTLEQRLKIVLNLEKRLCNTKQCHLWHFCS